MKRNRIYGHIAAALFLASLLVTGCKKETLPENPTQPESSITTGAQQLAPEDHTTITPERQKIIDFFKNAESNANSRTSAVVNRAVYQGFTVNYQGTVPNDIRGLVEGEINQLLQTSTTATTKTRMKGAPINVYNSPGSGDLFYTGGQVYIVNFQVYRQVHTAPGNVIFHELIHYLHDRYFSFNNSTIIGLWQGVRSRGVYPAGSYVLSNQVEYLGVTAEAFYCNTNRPPYNRSTVQSSDPNGAAFLNANF